MRRLALLLSLAVLPATLAAQDAVKTIKPGMTADEVSANWGKPLKTVTRGDFSYLYYANDCLKTCGMHDIVILEKGQVVDAIARASYHKYEGMSSSPADRKPAFTKPS